MSQEPTKKNFRSSYYSRIGIPARQPNSDNTSYFSTSAPININNIKKPENPLQNSSLPSPNTAEEYLQKFGKFGKTNEDFSVPKNRLNPEITGQRTPVRSKKSNGTIQPTKSVIGFNI